MDFEKKSLEYHSKSPKGKIALKNTKPLETQEDLSLAYSPGVAGPCRVIAEDQDASFTYTARSHLVGVVSNGSAVLGLGNIGPYAAKPVMEGKGMLFKKFADIDVFDIELNCPDNTAFIAAVKALEPTFGGINLEDIKAPDCFYIEQELQKSMQIPVFHDDQHGTAIIAAAAFLNALDLTQRDIQQTKVVFSGAGAAAISCAELLITLGVEPSHLILCDSKGIVHHERQDLNEFKQKFAVSTSMRSLEEALHGADAFIGVSAANILNPEMLRSMAKDPIVFALANPDPEIQPDLAKQVREDVIIATGRSDHPNQVNNVLGFPYIFRGALDVRAKCINEEMKLAAVHAIAKLAREDVPEEVVAVYKKDGHYSFGRDYLIPKPIDQRVLLRVAPAVAAAAMKSGVARLQIDIVQYEKDIEKILGPTRQIIRTLRTETAQLFHRRMTSTRPRIVLTSGHDERVIKAASQVSSSGEVRIVLLGDPDKIRKNAEKAGVSSLQDIEIINPLVAPQADKYAEEIYKLRQRKGISRSVARSVIHSHAYFATMMLHCGDVDGMLGGIKSSYSDAVRPILQLIPRHHEALPTGIYMLVIDEHPIFFADCTIHADPDAEQLAKIASITAEVAARYTKDPVRVAMLSFASFGSSSHPSVTKVGKAVDILRRELPDLEVDGEMQVDVALNSELREQEFPFCRLKGRANVLVFPDLSSANIAYKLLSNVGERPIPTGPILAGMSKPAHVLQRTASVQEIVNMIYLTAHEIAAANPS
ncbi:MAG: NADP-dependent malic enzyme [Zetaproteobacteria bacterium]|nr:NADP-dependent malic enzyme [Zetaproteobacteria bacterium]